jgi:hypothetical protein
MPNEDKPITNKNQAQQHVLDGLTWLIINHARCTASEQYSPSKGPDESDDYIKEHKEWVVKLRKLREEFENLVTGLF